MFAKSGRFLSGSVILWNVYRMDSQPIDWYGCFWIVWPINAFSARSRSYVMWLLFGLSPLYQMVWIHTSNPSLPVQTMSQRGYPLLAGATAEATDQQPQVETKWPTFSYYFLQKRLFYFDPNFVVVCSQGSSKQKDKLDFNNGLASSRRRTIIWTNDGLVYWRICIRDWARVIKILKEKYFIVNSSHSFRYFKYVSSRMTGYVFKNHYSINANITGVCWSSIQAALCDKHVSLKVQPEIDFCLLNCHEEVQIWNQYLLKIDFVGIMVRFICLFKLHLRLE